MDDRHEKMWTSTKEYYEKLLLTASKQEKDWFIRRVKSCQTLLDTC